MIQGYVVEEGRLRAVPAPLEALTGVIWIELIDPSATRRGRSRRRSASTCRPARRWRRSRISSRLYPEDGATFMTATAVQAEREDPVRRRSPSSWSGPTGDDPLRGTPRLQDLPGSAPSGDLGCTGGRRRSWRCSTRSSTGWPTSSSAAARSTASRAIFRPPTGVGGVRLQAVLAAWAGRATSTPKVRDSLVSLERLFVFAPRPSSWGGSKDGKRAAEFAGAGHALPDRARRVAVAKITFLLDAALGLINIEQNAIIKIFSVGAVCSCRRPWWPRSTG